MRGGAGDVQDRTTALCEAAFNGHIEVVRELLGKGADVNMVDEVNKLTYLHIRIQTDGSWIAGRLGQTCHAASEAKAAVSLFRFFV